MLHASLTTVFTAVVTTNIFLILLTLYLTDRKLLLDTGYRLLTLFVLFTALRLTFPFELPFTVTIRLPKVISPAISHFYVQLGAIGRLPISLWTLFLMIWAAGTVLGLIHYIFSYCKDSYLITLYGKELTHKTPYKELLEKICKEHKRRNRFRVVELPGLSGPVLFGIFSPRILIPEGFNLSEQNLYYILRHETAHHFHHDLLLKSIIKIITLAYWWNPFCRKLNEQTDAILEMRVDDTLTRTDIQLTEEYMRCLIAAGSFASQNTFLSSDFTMGLFPKETSEIQKRFTLLRYNQRTQHPIRNILLVLATLSIYLLSYAFVGEPYNPPSNIPLRYPDEPETWYLPSAANSYFIDNGDGTYDLYYNDEYSLTVDTLKYHDANIPVYTEDHRPQ